MLRVLYRYCKVENNKRRPSWYSKHVCLMSLIAAAGRVPCASLTLLSDGELPEDIAALARDAAGIVRLHRSGNAESFLQALSIAMTYAPDDLVYFVEDDYLHTADALEKLCEASSDCPGDYFTLYDHPDRYLPASHPQRDPLGISTNIFISRSHHWRSVESTCMTFAAKVAVLIADAGVLMSFVSVDNIPHDRALFRCLQGLSPSPVMQRARVLLGPVPALATHCESAHLAPHVDWGALAVTTNRRHAPAATS